MLSTSPASDVMRSMTAGVSYPPSEKMCTVQHQAYASNQSQGALLQAAGLAADGEMGRFGPTPTPAGSGVGVHPPRRGAPDRCLSSLMPSADIF